MTFYVAAILAVLSIAFMLAMADVRGPEHARACAVVVSDVRAWAGCW